MNICVIVTNLYLHIIPLPGLSFYASALIGVLVFSMMLNNFGTFNNICTQTIILFELLSSILYGFTGSQSVNSLCMQLFVDSVWEIQRWLALQNLLSPWRMNENCNTALMFVAPLHADSGCFTSSSHIHSGHTLYVTSLGMMSCRKYFCGICEFRNKH